MLQQNPEIKKKFKPFLDRMADKTLKELLGHVEKSSDKDSGHPLVDLHHEDPEWVPTPKAAAARTLLD
ncbi:U520 [Culex quinquefasciatus]|uniref:U520 n=1 Tax=Culex quinquefasciatus TaxID=7176 RepID=B0WTN1_CULQU|nr:U520 [Culex quinquefasciatus]|eukprot:XP_001855123.1 U520 [Culex quinquefasciatus]